MPPDEFNCGLGDVEDFREELQESAICRSINGRSGDTHFQLAALDSNNSLTRSTRLELDRNLYAARDLAEICSAHAENF